MMAHTENSLTTQLSENEKAEFEALESVIQRELGSFIAVGKALLTIRDSRLYREQFKTFKAYCLERWGMARGYANRLISGAKVAANLLQIEDFSQTADFSQTVPHGIVCAPCEIQPTNEYQIRPLSVLEPAQQCEVWEEAVRSADGKTITYKQVKALVDEKVGPAAPIPPKKKDPYAHSDAYAFATMAILQLERIKDDDPLRYEGLGRVLKWIEKKLTSWQPNKKQGAKRRAQCQEFLKRTTTAASSCHPSTEK